MQRVCEHRLETYLAKYLVHINILEFICERSIIKDSMFLLLNDIYTIISFNLEYP
jgi:hypothetical protein